MSDLESVESGAIVDYLNKIYHIFDKHIRTCDICTGKGKAIIKLNWTIVFTSLFPFQVIYVRFAAIMKLFFHMMTRLCGASSVQRYFIVHVGFENQIVRNVFELKSES